MRENIILLTAQVSKLEVEVEFLRNNINEFEIFFQKDFFNYLSQQA
jgi:hypothetical protein